ncbi:hypothetical protein SAMN05877753_102388 [Bacillus oleivorans]|uniref:YpoC-like domain-containing protein n=2 Tax=Bacillus oleivorans TaxID=1448271 RepID=A0A285CKV0_9BACI|nr:hypothetical protein SAMN05877753_102388 [Bacillus oleivorans]
MSVPPLMRHPLLLPDVTWEYEDSILDSNQLNPSFRYDSAYHQDLPALKPWENRENAVQSVVKGWKEVSGAMQTFLKERNSKASLPYMVKGLQLYTMLLFWGNGKPVLLYDLFARLQLLRIKPTNIEDRLSFILERPTLYHSFIQLGELFIETEKQIMKDITIAKVKSQRKI